VSLIDQRTITSEVPEDDKLLIFVWVLEVHTNKLTIGLGADMRQLFLCSLRELGLSKTFKQISQPCSEKTREQFSFGIGPK
jgi:hypothetical protein